jgi:hypothetical protein
VTEYEIPCTSQRPAIIQRAFVEDNMVVRVSGDTIALSPQLIASEAIWAISSSALAACCGRYAEDHWLCCSQFDPGQVAKP